MDDYSKVIWTVGVPLLKHDLFLEVIYTSGEIQTQGPFKSISKLERQARDTLARADVQAAQIHCRLA